jgi:hypothetical protein
MEATGSCAGIENYSRYLTGRNPGDPPPTLFEYLPDNALVFTMRAMSPCRRSAACSAATTGARRRWRNTDSACRRAWTIVRCGSRSGTRCARRRSHVSATPGGWEMDETGGTFVEQVIRPTGLIDPPVEIRSAKSRSTICSTRCGRSPRRLSHARDHADQAHGRGSDRVHARSRASACATCTPTSRRWSASRSFEI